MAKFKFTKATKTGTFLRLALLGPAGSGKTWTALALAEGLGKRVAVIDTEHGSASKYAKDFDFDACSLESFEPLNYVEAIGDAVAAGFDVVIVDSLSHAWMGKGGALEQVDRAKKRSNGNGFSAWGDVTPQHNALVDAMLRCDAHLIVTMRTKMEYVQERDERTGKTVVRKVGMAPVQRDGLEYEFDVVGDLDAENNLSVTKTRCSALSGEVIAKPGAALAATLAAWLSDAEPVVRQPPADEARGEEPKREAPPPAIPAALAAFHAALPSLATPADGAALWLAHRPALNAAAEAPRKAAWTELAKALTKFGGGVGSFSAATKFVKRKLAEHDEQARAHVEPSADEVAQGRAANDPDANHAPEVHTPAEAPATEASPETQPPAVVAFLAAVAAIELPGEGTVAWIKHRADLAPLPVADREGAWKALVARVETVGRMTNASPWLKKAVLAADANAQLAAEAAAEPAGLPGDVMDALLADLGTARDAATLSTTWAAIAEGEWHDATPAQRVRLESARTAREKALRTPPTPPRGTRSRTAAAPVDASGNGTEAPANDVAGATMSTADRWRMHLAAKPRTGKLCGAGGVAASWVKHRDELTEAGARAECLAITIDELAARGIAEPGAWLDGVRERREAQAA